MTTFAGSLLEAIPKLKLDGRSIGFVVVDEQSTPETPTKGELGAFEKNEAEVTAAQNKLIEFATRFNFPVWFVEIASTGGSKPTRADLRELAPKNLCVVPKTAMNPFTSSNLFEELKNAKIDTIVLLGFQVNCCVRMTAVGGDPGPFSKGKPSGNALQQGATALGFQVLTCQQVLRGQNTDGDIFSANWKNEDNVRFYSSL
jgi:nicotinamidase-related amidase